MADEFTPNLGLPLPQSGNPLYEDVVRLRTGILAIDSAVAAKADLVGGKVPAAQLPAYVDDVVEVANFAALPATGEGGKIYVTIDNGHQYRWGGSAYTELRPSPGTTDDVPEGAVNKYFSDARVAEALPTASETVKGAVKIGDGLVVDEFGFLHNPDASAGVQSFTDEEIVATAGQTVFSVPGGYVVDQVDVHLNGAKLAAADYVATNGTTVTLVEAASDGDILVVRKWLSFSLALIATKLQAEAGTNNSKVMTPLRVAQAITAQAGKVARDARTGNVKLLAADRGKLIDITSGTFTQTLDPAATLGSGWWCWMLNSGSGTVTINPDGAETINGAETLQIEAGHLRLLHCDGVELRAWLLAGDVAEQIMVVRDEKPSGTGGGAPASGMIWTTRTLNTVQSNSITGAALSGNQITLPAGVYDVRGSVPSCRAKAHKSRVANAGSGATLIAGSSAVGVSGAVQTSISLLAGTITLAATTQLKVEHWINFDDSSTSLGDGFGAASSAPGENEIYTELTIRKIG